MWHVSYWLLRTLSGMWFWGVRKFSMAGKVVFGVLIVGAALGIDTSQTLAYQAYTFALAGLVLALATAWLVRPRLEVAGSPPRVVSAGQAFSYRVRVRNAGRRVIDGVGLLEDPADPRPTFAQFRSRLRFPSYRGWWRLLAQSRVARIGESAVPALVPGAQAEVELNGYAHQRGTLVLEGFSVARADPLGLVRSFRRIPRPAKIVVLPKRYEVPSLALGGARRYQHGGVSLATSVGDSEEFIGLRDYRPGDPLQRIHWKSFARIGNPVVREYQDEFFERRALILDTACSDRESQAFEEAVSVAASFACTLNVQESLLDLLFVGAEAYCFTAGRGQMQAGHLVEVLASVRARPDKSFTALAESVYARRGELSACILVLVAWDDARRKLVERLNASAIPMLALLVATTEPADKPASVHWLQPGKIEEGLARL